MTKTQPIPTLKNTEVRKVSQSTGFLEVRTTSSGTYRIGCVATPYGFASVYAQEDFWSVEFIFTGRLYRTSDRCSSLPSQLALARRASKFVKQIVQTSLNQLNKNS
ncbi:MAG: hypothetical protein RMY36_032475 [Nostoc sp. SerVER01]|nr:hypothetical protein [Nostoc sp. SerVER01]